MDIDGVVREIEGTVEAQLRLAGDDAVITEAAESLLAALDPAIRQAVGRMAEQAATEVTAQLGEQTVDVVMSDGEPTLVVRTTQEAVTVSTEDLEARITVRLPAELKEHLELAAGEHGDSVNTFVVKTLSARSKRKTTSNKFKGTIQT